MKDFTKSLLCVLCLTAAFLTCGAIILNAQTMTENSKSVKNIFAEIVRAKGRDNSFVLLTPDDLSKFSPTELAVFLNSADPCDMATPINFGQTVNGQLTNADCRLDDNSYADFYTFNGTAGQNITIYGLGLIRVNVTQSSVSNQCLQYFLQTLCSYGAIF